MSEQSAGRRVDPWGRKLAGPGREDLYLTAEETESGIDLKQLRRNLTLTPTERLVLATLSRHGVDFVVIGGAAAVLLGAELPTGDVDVIYSMSEDNLAKLAAALTDLEAESKRLPGLRTDDLAALLSGSDLWRWETRYGDLDMMT